MLENSGKFKGKGMWKLPTGVVDEVSMFTVLSRSNSIQDVF